MKNNTPAKVFAVLALFGIVSSVVATGALFILSPTTVVEKNQEVSSGELDLTQMNSIGNNGDEENSQTGEVEGNTNSGETEEEIQNSEENTNSGEIENVEPEIVPSEVSENETSENEVIKESEEAISNGEEVTE